MHEAKTRLQELLRLVEAGLQVEMPIATDETCDFYQVGIVPA